MRISAISNNQIRVANNNKQKKNNVSFNGVKEFLNTDMTKVLNQKISGTTAFGIVALGMVSTGFLVDRIEKNRDINKIGNFINDKNYNKNSLKVQDYTNDGIVDFELTDKNGKKVVYDAVNNRILEYTPKLQEVKH